MRLIILLGKGGRAWLTGEFTLEELEAICHVIRLKYDDVEGLIDSYKASLEINPSDDDILEEFGWVMECESPLEIRHEGGSFASGYAATLVISQLRTEYILQIEG